MVRRFLPGRYLRSPGELTPLRPGRGGAEWILARGCCVHYSINCRQVPAAKRADFVTAQVKRLSVWPDAEWYSTITGDDAQVWIWSRGEIRSAEEVGATARHARILPETLFRGAPRTEGGELLSMHLGYEGRIWKQGALAATHWWASNPNERDWSLFCRSAGVPVCALPATQVLPLLEQPWLAATSSAQWLGQLRQHRKILLSALAVVFCVALGYQLGTVAQLYALIRATQHRIDAQRAAASDILDARMRAEQSRAALQALLVAVAKPTPLDTLSQFTQTMPSGNWRLIQWYQSTPLQIEATLQGQSLDPPQIVRALDNSKGFTHVTANVAANDSTLLLITGKVRMPPSFRAVEAPSS